ncbi:hypothetical protein B0H11DRAFT_2209855 [Mycena galericulata]|nr:hypothetical protein B0H11DRAFT_2209855 [Mycena galericulata]
MAPSYIFRSIVWTILVQRICALPSPHKRASASAMSVQQLTQAALEQYLQGINVVNMTGVHFTTSWTPIDFAGNDGGISPTEVNSIMYKTCDLLPDISDGSPVYFSETYTNFIQEVNKRLPNTTSEQNNTQLNSAIANQASLCDKPKEILGQAVNDYLSAVDLDQVPSGNTSDPGLLQWASVHYAPYMEANNLCVGAQNDVSRILDTINGDDGALFANMRVVLSALTTDTPSSQPGINMPVTANLPGTKANGANSYAPLYYVPLLNGTVTSWQQNLLSNAPATFAYNYSHGQTDNNTKTTSGSGGVSFIWDDFSGSASGSGSTTTKTFNQSAESFSLSFAAISNMEIETGIWFDGYQVAWAAHEPPKGDNVSALATPAFDDYFGTASKPLSASRYNSQMIIGFRPTWAITLSNESEYSQLKTTSAGAEACFLFICAGGSGSSSSNHTTTDDSTKTITFQDTSNNAYILGFIMSSFWSES